MKINPTAEKHIDCEVIIKFKKYNNENGYLMALHCEEHNKHIKWLSEYEYNELLSLGIKEVMNLDD